MVIIKKEPAAGPPNKPEFRENEPERRNRTKHQPYKYGESFLEKNINYMLIYQELLKDERVWANTGQYWLAKEAGRRATCLLNGDVDGYLQWTKSEDLCV